MSLHLSIYIIILFISTDYTSIIYAQETSFDQNYAPSWGGDHVVVLDQGRQVQIKIDPYSGGGFKSKRAYGSGLFKLNIKIPQHASGIVTAFYLTSEPDNGPGGAHSELDFELLGNIGQPYKLHTNIFAQDNGGREQEIKLWFDPTSDFHEYKIIWNQYQIVFFVDGTPVRVARNYTKIGAKYPELPMYAHVSLWNGTQWLGQTDWSKGPFYANFRDFTIKGCSCQDWNITICASPKYGWNSPKFQKLDAPHQILYENVKKSLMTYDYCNNAHSTNNFPECKMHT